MNADLTHKTKKSCRMTVLATWLSYPKIKLLPQSVNDYSVQTRLNLELVHATKLFHRSYCVLSPVTWGMLLVK